jgi:hypothetical protein
MALAKAETIHEHQSVMQDFSQIATACIAMAKISRHSGLMGQF